ncbi:MAG: Gx transporter family protein [Spirochaetaceae bacterium]|jgi:uncharacterized membrane protein|nr:Gx transporter family protein [Spirochaetaceae bacterium]
MYGRQRYIAVLGALSLFLGGIEYLIPKPLPVFRLGLANLPLLLALRLPIKEFATIAFIKTLGQCLLSGTLFSPVALLSVAGTAASAIVMRRLSVLPARLISFAGISLAGAFASNIAQLFIAGALIFGKGVRFFAPPMLAAGAVTGIALGVFCEKFTQNSKWFKELSVIAANKSDFAQKNLKIKLESQTKRQNALCFLRLLPAITGAGALLAAQGLKWQLALFGVFWLIAALRRRAGSAVFIVFYFALIVFINLLNPFGREIARVGPFSITEGAVKNALAKAALIQGLLLASRGLLPRRIFLPGNAGALFSQTLAILALFTEAKKKVSFKNPVAALDKLLFSVMEHNKTEIFFIDIREIKEDELSVFTAKLPAEEAQNAEKFISFSAKKQRVFGRLLLYRYLLREPELIPPRYGGNGGRNNSGSVKIPELKYTENGKPYFEDGPKFSLSHSGGIVCAAFSNINLGIDIENKRNLKPHNKNAFFCEQEAAFIHGSANYNNDFLWLWTRKEALLKAKGTGFFAGALNYNCLENSVTDENELWHIKSFMLRDTFFAALCTAEPCFYTLKELSLSDLLKDLSYLPS